MSLELSHQIIARNIAIAQSQYKAKIDSIASENHTKEWWEEFRKNNPHPRLKVVKDQLLKFRANITEDSIPEDWNNIQTPEEFTKLAEKMTQISAKIDMIFEDMRSDAHSELYGFIELDYALDYVKNMPKEEEKLLREEGWKNASMKYSDRNLHTDRINTRLKYYMNITEDAINRNIASDKIDIRTIIKKSRGLVDYGPSHMCREIKDLVILARNESGWYEMSFRDMGAKLRTGLYEVDNSKTGLRNFGYVPKPTIHEILILMKFTKHIILEKIKLFKEEMKYLPDEIVSTLSEKSEEYFANRNKEIKEEEEAKRWIKQPVRDAVWDGLENIIGKSWTDYLYSTTTGYKERERPEKTEEKDEPKSKKKSEPEFSFNNRLLKQDKDLLIAAASHDRGQLFSLLKKGADPFAKDDKGRDAPKLISMNTSANLFKYILSFLFRLDRYKLYYDVKDYLTAYNIAEKRLCTNDKSKIINEANQIYSNERANHNSVTYDKIILEDANLCGYRNSSSVGYILSFIIQTEAYRESGYYHIRDNRVKYAKQNPSTTTIDPKYQPSFAEKIGYRTSILSR